MEFQVWPTGDVRGEKASQGTLKITPKVSPSMFQDLFSLPICLAKVCSLTSSLRLFSYQESYDMTFT